MEVGAITTDAAASLQTKCMLEMQLIEQQLVESYCKAMKLQELPVQNANRPERDWDKLFERLEERFLIVGNRMSSEIKCLCVCRLLRGVPLQVWHDLGAQLRSYEERRDAFMLHFFPVTQEYERLWRSLTSQGPSPTKEVVAATPSSPGTDTTASSIAPKTIFSGRLSLPAVRAQVGLQRSRIRRIVSRHPSLTVLPDSVYIQYAISLMKPSIAAIAAPISSENAALSLEEFLEKVASQVARTPALEKTGKQRTRRSRKPVKEANPQNSSD